MNSDIINQINRNPHEGMSLLMEKYTGLVWKVISFHLSNPEDIKECVNDTFTEFYLCRDHFDAQKADIPTFLAAIARNLSIARYRKESIRQTTPLSDSYISENLLLISTESRIDLERAIKALGKNEQQIILMKYYNGMTIREIASSLSLPYETVKKRHQRSLGKLRYLLLCILFTLLLALFTACAYKILLYYDVIPPLFRKFSIDFSLELPRQLPEKQKELSLTVKEKLTPLTSEITPSEEVIPAAQENTHPSPDDYSYVPGYGVNEAKGTPAYKLFQSIHTETDKAVLSLNDASYINGVLRIDITVYAKDTSIYNDAASCVLHHNGNTIVKLEHSTYFTDENTEKNEIKYHNTELISHMDENEQFFVELYGISLPFALVPAESETIENNYYQLEEYGGVMAIPRLENSSLIVTIYPLNHGEYSTLPGLIRGIKGESEGAQIYVTDENGTKYPGTCMNYRPYTFLPYYEWNFGQAAAGQYTLHIPYLYQSAKLPEDFAIPLNLENLTWSKTGYPVPGGEITVENCSLIDLIAGERIGDSYIIYEENNTNTYWDLCLKCHSYEKEHTIIGLDLMSICPYLPEDQIGELADGEIHTTYSFIKNNTQNNTIQAVISANHKANDFSMFYLAPASKKFGEYQDTILYRWNQSFDLTFNVTKTTE